MTLNQIVSRVKVVDLFCGIGGLTHGLNQAKLNVVAGYDIDSSCRYAYEANNKSKFFEKDIKTVTSQEIQKHFENSCIRVLVGCAPCQPFSSYTQKRKINDKWVLIYEFERLIKEVEPEIISMENVAKLLDFSKAPIFQDFYQTLENLGYYVSFQIVNCADYGIPQTRKRLVLLASKFKPIEMISPTHKSNEYLTVRQAISHLSKINHGESCPSDFIHRSNKLSDTNIKRIQATKEGGSWKDWDDSLILNCHRKKSGKNYTSVYGRMWWDKPSPTITTHCVGYGNGRFGHPTQDRAISLREAAILQSFPDDYSFVPNKEALQVRRLSIHLGNAVPVGIGKAIGLSIVEHLKGIN